MNNDHKQIIPFPLPDYLSEFVVSQLEGPVETLGDGSHAKALHITRNSEFGKYIYRCLKKENKPSFAKEGYTMYIAASSYARITDKTIEEGRYSFLGLGEREIKEITSLFRSWFNTCLVHYIDGAKFAHSVHGRQRGIVHKAIVNFMETYNITQDKAYFETFRKHYQREKKAERQQLQRLV